MRVLIVEDSALVRKMYGLVFPARENELTAVENGHRALAAITEEGQQYDLILLDLRMPDMNGVEFIRAVQKNGSLGRTPIVLTTAEPDDSDLVREARALGVAGVVKKPWKPRELRAVVQSILQKPVR